MKSLAVLILALSLAAPASAVLPEKEGIISNIEMICGSDAPDTQALRENADEMLPNLRATIQKSRAFSIAEKTRYTAQIDTCIVGYTNIKKETAGADAEDTALPPKSVYGQNISGRCDMGLVDFTSDELKDPVKYSRFISAFNRLNSNGCFAASIPDNTATE